LANCLHTSTPDEARLGVIGATGTVSNHDGKLLYWIGINLDIDDEKRAEDALSAMKETLSRSKQIATVAELSASIAHKICSTTLFNRVKCPSNHKRPPSTMLTSCEECNTSFM
jgi:hypothetical protein